MNHNDLLQQPVGAGPPGNPVGLVAAPPAAEQSVGLREKAGMDMGHMVRAVAVLGLMLLIHSTDVQAQSCTSVDQICEQIPDSQFCRDIRFYSMLQSFPPLNSTATCPRSWLRP
mgnify:CR=1 FL=1